MTEKHYVGEVGTVLIIDCRQNITCATDTKLRIKKPDGIIVEKIATIYGTDSLSYTLVAGDFDQPGVYKLQSSLTIGGWSGDGETTSFRVEDKFN
jgi:hypothetical protein